MVGKYFLPEDLLWHYPAVSIGISIPRVVGDSIGTVIIDFRLTSGNRTRLIRINNPGDASQFVSVFSWHLKRIAIQNIFYLTNFRGDQIKVF